MDDCGKDLKQIVDRLKELQKESEDSGRKVREEIERLKGEIKRLSKQKKDSGELDTPSSQ